MQRFTELRVWRRGHQFTLEVYRLTASFPERERFGIVSQTRRAAVSIVSNIAEGSKRVSNAEYAHFLNIAEGSLAETEALLRLSRDLDFLKDAIATKLIREAEEIARMLSSLRTIVDPRESSGTVRRPT